MQKKLMAVAVAGALAAPAVALAQTSTVNIYGTVIVNYNVGFKQGMNKPTTDMLNSHDANIGFRGEEKLGMGLTAWFQCESTLDVTGNEAWEKGFCSRNSGVGLKGDWGNIFMGQWDTPYKMINSTPRIWSTSGAFGNAELMWNGSASNVGNGNAAANQGIGSGGAGVQRAGFSRRQANSIFYHSPSWSGFQVLAGYSTLNETTGGTAGDPDAQRKPRLWSIGASYTNGPLYIGAGYEQHSDYNPANQGTYTGGDDTAWSINGAYTFAGVFKVGLIYTSIEYGDIRGAGVAGNGDSKRDSWGIYADWNIQGPHRVRAGYTQANDTKGSGGGTAVLGQTTCGGGFVAINSGWCANGGRGGTGANLWGIQYAYAFSKRTELNFGYAALSNDEYARYALQTLGRPDTVGQNQHAWVLGINHKF